MKQVACARRVFVALALVAVSALSPVNAFAGDQDFTLHNETGREIAEVYVSSAATSEWEEDVLTDDTLPDGSSVEISFDSGEEAELWDLKIVFSDGRSNVWKRLSLTEITDVTISFRGGKPYAKTRNG